MCQACLEADAMFRFYLLETPAAREKLTDEEADYYGFRRDPVSGAWVDAWPANPFQAEAVAPSDNDKTPSQ